MAIPTRFIEQEEYEELLAVEEGDTIPLFKLTAIPFDPPRPTEEGAEEEPTPEPVAVRVMLLAVTEPRLYRDENKTTFVVFPSFETMDYAAAQDLHPVKGAWTYRFTPYGWNENYPLSHATYFFEEGEMRAYDLEDVSTH